LAAAGTGNRIRVWRLAGSVLRSVHTRHAGQLNAVSWSPDGRWLATASDDHTAAVWDADSGERRVTLSGHRSWVNDVAWSPDGLRLATSSADGTATIWAWETGRALAAMAGHAGPVVCVAWAPDGQDLVTAGADGTAMLWQVRDAARRSTLTGHTGRVFAAAYSYDGHYLATTADDGTVIVWDPATGTMISRTDVGRDRRGWVDSLAWSPLGNRLAVSGSEGRAHILDPASGSASYLVEGIVDAPAALAWSSIDGPFAVGHESGTVTIRGHEAGGVRFTWRLDDPDGRTARDRAMAFVTYAAADATALVRELGLRLRGWGVEPWLDARRVGFGNTVDDAVRQAIGRADAAIVVVTPAFLDSTWTQTELNPLTRARPDLPVLVVLLDLPPDQEASRLLNRLPVQAVQVRFDTARGFDEIRSWVERNVAPSPVAGEPAPAPSTNPGLDAKTGFLTEVAAGVPVNLIAGGGALVLPDDDRLPWFPLPPGGTVTLLSPDPAALRRAAADWRRVRQNAGAPVPTDLPAPTEDPGRSAPPRDTRFGGDRSPQNGASLAFLVEYEKSSCLITGQAHADRLEQSVRTLLRRGNLVRLRVDVTVLPHNGSRRNITTGLLAMLDCDRFVVATDGAYFGHPDEDVIALLGAHRANPVTVYFNYRSPTTERYADPEIQRRLNIHAVFPDSGGGLTIPVLP
jgi:hypothetical protein